jgi:hypothetical protein
MEGAPPVANQIDLFMHFLGASRDGLVARRVDLDMISSSVCSQKRSKLCYYTSYTQSKLVSQFQPHNGPLTDSHVITHFEVDIVMYT